MLWFLWTIFKSYVKVPEGSYENGFYVKLPEGRRPNMILLCFSSFLRDEFPRYVTVPEGIDLD